MKSYTDLEQSKKLVEILPTESADMEYLAIKESGKLVGVVPFVKDDSEIEDSVYSHIYDRIVCWSLAALLGVLPNSENKSITLSKGGYRISTFEQINDWFVDYEDETNGLNNCVTSADNPVDACVAMIEKLHELTLL